MNSFATQAEAKDILDCAEARRLTVAEIYNDAVAKRRNAEADCAAVRTVVDARRDLSYELFDAPSASLAAYEYALDLLNESRQHLTAARARLRDAGATEVIMERVKADAEDACNEAKAFLKLYEDSSAET